MDIWALDSRMHLNTATRGFFMSGTAVSEYTRRYLHEVQQITAALHCETIEDIIDLLLEARQKGGRLFFLGVGGSAGNAGHAVNDFRKIGGFEAYAPTDNVSELTARTNDDGWDSSFSNWLLGSRLRSEDVLFVFSVGGGNLEKQVSVNIVKSVQLAKEVGASVVGIVGRDGGYTAQVGDAVVIVPTVADDTVTPHAESFQAVIWHLIVSHPRLKKNEMKWESTR
jgi:D-sedoheptulose 7-phosphate isomerase